MKRLIVLLAITTLILAINAYAECTDSDGGQNYGEKGTVVWTSAMGTDEYVDQCLDETRVGEYFCESDGKTGFKRYDCPNGCEDGACVGIESPAETPEETVEETMPEETVEIPPEETEEPEITPAKTDSIKVWITTMVLVIIIGAAIIFLKLKKCSKEDKEMEKGKKETKKKK